MYAYNHIRKTSCALHKYTIIYRNGVLFRVDLMLKNNTYINHIPRLLYDLYIS